MQMKPYIPSKEWYICFSSGKKTEYATDKKLRGSPSIQPFFTHTTGIIIYFDHFRFSKDKHLSMQMKPYIPSKEWYICFSSGKKTEYVTDKKLRGSPSIQPFFTHITGIIIYFDHFRFSKDKYLSMQMKPHIPSIEWYNLCLLILNDG